MHRDWAFARLSWDFPEGGRGDRKIGKIAVGDTEYFPDAVRTYEVSGKRTLCAVCCMFMQNFRKVAEGIDVAPLLAAIAGKPELWQEIEIRQLFPGSPHRETRCIYIRGPKGFSFDEYLGDAGSLDYEAASILRDVLVPLCKPLLLDVLQASEVGRVMLVGLQPRGRVYPHVDEGAYAEHFPRFHLCLQSDPASTLEAGGEIQHIAPGELWWFNHRTVHSASNDADTERIHLILDAVCPGYEVQPQEGTNVPCEAPAPKIETP